MAGTEYPNQIDGFTQLPLVADLTSPIRAENVNILRNTIVAIETELGVNPSGTFGHVKARLDYLETILTADGYIDASSILVDDVDGYFDGYTVEDVLAEIGAELNTFVSSVVATDVSISDSDGYFTTDNVEEALRELAALTDILNTVNFTLDYISGHIEEPSDKIYYLTLNSPYGGEISSVTTKADSGTCTATVSINGTPLGGTANAVSSTEVVETHSSSNIFSAGDDIELTVSSNSSTDDMRFTIEFIRSS